MAEMTTDAVRNSFMVTPFYLTGAAQAPSALATGHKLASREHHHLRTPSPAAERAFLRNEGAFMRN
jgi:hypothetical protein